MEATGVVLVQNPCLPPWILGWTCDESLRVRTLSVGTRTYRLRNIGTIVSKGCIRMYNQDLLDLYPLSTCSDGIRMTVNVATIPCQ